MRQPERRGRLTSGTAPPRGGCRTLSSASDLRLSPPPQPGLCQEGVYQREGDPERAAQLLEDFSRDARNVKLREKEQRLEEVTDTLKDFLAQAEDALLAKELYPYWVSALGTDRRPHSAQVLVPVLVLEG